VGLRLSIYSGQVKTQTQTSRRPRTVMVWIPH